jgi:hypothetical protein
MSTCKNTLKFGKEWRKCSKQCGRILEATTENFSPQKLKLKDGTIWYGLRPDCKECRREEGRIAWHKKKGHYTTSSAVENRSGGMGLL